MNKAVRPALILVLALSMLTALMPAALMTQSLAVGAPEKINYAAFGDSIAAGVRGGAGAPGSEQMSDKGYTDDIAALLKSAGVLGSFNKDFCASGITAKVLAQDTAVLKDATSSGASLVRNADIITLDIGANDILGPLYDYLGALNSAADFDFATFRQLLKNGIDDLYNSKTSTEIRTSIETTLQNMLSANGSVRIFVMGYYNPLPLASALLGIGLNDPIKYLNTLIRGAISDVRTKYPNSSVSYVATFDAIAAAAGSLVMTDIHPTESGHHVIAGEFWKQIGPLADILKKEAVVSASHFSMNGRRIPLGAYLIGNSNYVKLRDIAMALSGTAKQRAVTWDSGKDIVTITTGKPYVPVGSELTPIAGGGPVIAQPTQSVIVMDGAELSLTVYIIGGNNYIKLRDLTAAFNIGLHWDAATDTVRFDLTQGYTPAS